jgi:sulfur-oxidizing protein SoxY
MALPRLAAWSCTALALAVVLAVSPATAAEDPWPGLRKELFAARDIAENDGALQLYAPAQAEDAAVVPVSIRLPASIEAEARKITLIIDRNPAPVAAEIVLGPGYTARGALGERNIELRIRVDSFSKVRAVLETADGKLHMSSKFVAGAGGCSAAAAKDADEALASIGKMQVRAVIDAGRGEQWREAVVMIRHPSFTGMQIDPVSRGYTPAWFIEDIDIRRGDQPMMRIRGGISISENPNIRFNFISTGADTIDVSARDTKGNVFSGRSAANGS